ncbi:hypothetical protein AMS68_001107 [Peltaster fructicola]|uniref:Nudix hydrolase domain-containing protein n=1 Tax=Peltaster fructicola TaxID=286661 RepID=A0A6H0XM64_9PEZI|nr:hypothetical protein AMS68_001107 [Peltaster fructicola]
MPPRSSLPVHAAFLSEDLTVGAGVAIFHLATARVVVCWHSEDKYWFLPKGRKNANEDVRVAAEREGFEESGYRNRLLPLPMKHRQTDPDEGHEEYVLEPIWTHLMPLTSTKQYLLFWYIAETIPADEEAKYANHQSRAYRAPAPYPPSVTLKERIAMDSEQPQIYQPVWHEGTGVNEDELLYKSYLLTVDEALSKLRGNAMADVMGDVVRRGWKAIEKRMAQEAQTLLEKTSV